MTLFSSGACCSMLLCLWTWIKTEWADHTYSLPTLTQTLIALYVNKGFQCTVGQRLKCTMGAPLLSRQAGSSKNVLERVHNIDTCTDLDPLSFESSSTKTLQIYCFMCSKRTLTRATLALMSWSDCFTYLNCLLCYPDF